MRRLLAWAGAALLASSTPGWGGAPPAPMTLRYRFRQGQVLRYRVTMDVRAAAPGQQPGASAPAMGVSGTTTMRVLKVGPDGSARVAVTVRGFRLAGMGQDRQSGERTVSYTITPRGQMRDVKLPPGAKSPQMMGSLVNPEALSAIPAVLPDRPVRPGDTWSSVMPNPLIGAQPLRVRSRFVRMETLQGVRTARLQQAFVVPIEATTRQPSGAGTTRMEGRVSVNSVASFAVASGILERSTMSGAGAIRMTTVSASAQAQSPLTISLKIRTTMARQQGSGRRL